MLSSAMLVGLTGGLATGKSTAARMFQELGATIIDADELARRVVQPGQPAWREIVRQFGRHILLPDQTFNRSALADIVFQNPDKLGRLNAIIHPRVAREQTRLTRAIQRTNPDAIVVYDVPLLFEAGVDKRVDRIVVVTADRQTQLARLQRRNHLTKTEALQRLRAQLPLRYKRTRADYLLDGTLPLPQLRRAIEGIYEEWKGEAVNRRAERGPTRKQKFRSFPPAASRSTHKAQKNPCER